MYYCVNVIKNLNLNGRNCKLNWITSISLIVMLSIFIGVIFLAKFSNICCHQVHPQQPQDIVTNFVSLDHQSIDVSICTYFNKNISNTSQGEGKD